MQDLSTSRTTLQITNTDLSEYAKIVLYPSGQEVPFANVGYHNFLYCPEIYDPC
jgi:hypothetical protein